MLAPTTTDERIASAAELGSGYIYYVSLKGVTGASTLDVDDVSNQLARIRNLTQIPVGVGFGIKDAETAAKVSKVADGVIVGSALVNTIANHANETDTMSQSVANIVGEMRDAMDKVE